MNIFKHTFEKMKQVASSRKAKHQLKVQKRAEREPNPKVVKAVAFMNKYSIFFHMLLACFLCFVIECISRRNVFSAFTFVGGHTGAYLYNSFIIFVTLSLAYLVRRRILVRLLVSGFWVFLGTVNGCILSKRVTPFGFTDLDCISDLLAMQNTNYFTAGEAILVVSIVALFIAGCVWLFVKGPKYKGITHKYLSPIFVVCVCVMLSFTTKAAQKTNIVASYFSNIAQGYENYGFVYGFSSSVVDRGMRKPDDYSADTINKIKASVNVGPTTVDSADKPNIICVLLESFVDPSEIKFLNCSQDPIPNFHALYNNYSSGHLTVPVVGAGTANTEFEVLSGMSLQYFGTGEYPYKTRLMKTDCESIASDLSKIGYGTHAVHNNGGNFYSRVNAFSQMGFDTFTSKECMNIQQYTPLGDWPTDNILVGETLKALDSTPNKPDFCYTITVQGHGDYPSEKIIANPEIKVTGAKDEATNNKWEYYVNEIHEVDKFIGNLTNELSKRNEKTIVVMFGDHLPTMGLTENDMATGDIFKTKYITWNNYGLPKQDADLKAYQLLANTTYQVGIHEGTMFTYTQSQKDSPDYLTGLDDLQYDLLYGDRYAYNGEDKYPATKVVMGIDNVEISSTWLSSDGSLCIYGSNFTPWTKVFVNGSKVATNFVSSSLLRIDKGDYKDGDKLVANLIGAGGTIFRSSNEFVYKQSESGTEKSSQTGTTGNSTVAPIDPLINAPANNNANTNPNPQ